MAYFDKKMEMIDQQQARLKELNTLSKGFQVANIFINKGYLDSFSTAPIVQQDQFHVHDVQKLRVFHMEKIVFDPGEDINDKITSIYGALYSISSTVAVLIHGTKTSAKFYFATRSDTSASLAGEVLSSNLQGNFPGIDLTAYKSNEIESILKTIGQDENGMDMLNGLASVSTVPSLKDKEQKDKYVQGLEKFLNTMRGKEYLAVLLAVPVNNDTIAIRRHGLEELYSTMSPHAKLSYTYGENDSMTIGRGISASFTKSVNESVTNTNGTSSSSSSSDSYSSSSGSSFSFDGWGSSSGSSHSSSSSYTSGTSFSHSISNSVGRSQSDSISDNKSETKGSSETRTLNYENKGISELMKKIEDQLNRLNAQEAYGMWENAAYFFSNEVYISALAAATYKSVMAGETSGVEQAHVNIWSNSELTKQSIREIYEDVRYLVHPQAQIELSDDYRRQLVTPTSMVSSAELALLLGLPRKSVAGIAVQEMAEFGRAVVYENKLPDKTIHFGRIYHMGITEDTPVEMDLNLFSSHCFITGSSGSGKSYATYNLLDKLIENGIGMLVIEPAKGEYKQIFGNLKNINIYTTDPASYRFLRINPFQFPEKIHVLSHIEQLIQIFSAAWPLYAAMPALLKKSVVQAYVHCGWDIQNSIWVPNICDHKYPVFKDVMEQLPRIINGTDYTGETLGNYKGALLTRIEEMTTGLNGQIFRNSEGISASILFDSNTIIDLSEVGSGETIALIMGIMIMQLNEYRRSQRKLGLDAGHDSSLKHITVLEEAHNLLKRTNTEQGEDGGNLAGKSVEMISNSIKEMRTYGEGFLIIDQSPLAVDSSAIENTSTKIILNTPSKDACEEIGSALSLTEEQTKELSKLNVGIAAVMQKGWMSPVLMRVDQWDSHKYEAPMQYEERTKMVYVRTCLFRELNAQIKNKAFKARPLGEIIRKSDLNSDRKMELNEIVSEFNKMKAKSRELKPAMIGELFLEIMSCRAMLDAVPRDNIMTAAEFGNAVDDKQNTPKILAEQTPLVIQWINHVKNALDLYVRIENEEKNTAILYMLAFLTENGDEPDSSYTLIFEMFESGWIESYEMNK